MILRSESAPNAGVAADPAAAWFSLSVFNLQRSGSPQRAAAGPLNASVRRPRHARRHMCVLPLPAFRLQEP